MHLHNLVNHLPILFPFAGLLVLLLGIYFKSELLKRTGYFLFIVAALGAFMSMNTGEEAEEAIEGLYPKSTHHWAHEHEEKAELFAMIMYGLGFLSLLGVWASWARNKLQKYILWAIAAFLVAALYLGYETGASGGQVIHKEFRSE
jgi:uncharacterized membrane protein